MAVNLRLLFLCVLPVCIGLLSVSTVKGAYVNSTVISNSTTNSTTTPAAINDGGNDDGSPSTGLTVLYVFLGIIGGILGLIFLCCGCIILCKQCGNCEDAEVKASCECCGDTVWQKSY